MKGIIERNIERIIDSKYFLAILSIVLGLIPILMSLLAYQNEGKRKEVILFVYFGASLILVGIISALGCFLKDIKADPSNRGSRDQEKKSRCRKHRKSQILKKLLATKKRILAAGRSSPAPTREDLLGKTMIGKAYGHKK